MWLEECFGVMGIYELGGEFALEVFFVWFGCDIVYCGCSFLLLKVFFCIDLK